MREALLYSLFLLSSFMYITVMYHCTGGLL